jgi:hypothetical protein
MMRVFSKTGFPLKAHLDSGVYELEIPFEKKGYPGELP